ncbi:PadR family transcriptional regulator [Micromonospora inyonensis]|uniref:DNA-binding transcriptional regulator, PadR family n=1 Tax=Micromonospora inyonensis TaxID=47866 RepID=A0A1C6SAI7_9ACTN|nr:PadR family transcriptional regulator [Micromonospora inyonensis]SCL26458.1 DNA-binding transcriptional regulator, PadR family [Micromonospora inyonensis]
MPEHPSRRVHVGPGGDPDHLPAFPPMPPKPVPPPPPAPPPSPAAPVPPGGRSARMRRGDVRAALLALLDEQPRNGYQLIQAVAERSGGRWRPSPGAVYPALSQLEEEGLVAVTGTGSDRRCHLTEAGRAFVAAHRDRVHEPWRAAARLLPERVADVRHALDGLTSAVAQVGSTGTDDQLTRAVRVLDTARHDLYRILADDHATEAGTRPDPTGDPR